MPSTAKALTHLLMTVLAAVLPAMTGNRLDGAAWVNVVILAAGAITVYVASNDIPGWPYVKLIASAVSAVAVILASVLATGHGIDATAVIQMVLAAAAALGVGAVPNGQADTDAPTGPVYAD